MQITVARPPNFDEVIARFPFADRHGVIFTYGQTIYNPSGVEISPALKCHESVHAQRQGSDEEEIRAWWARYLDEPLFRLEEELLAHRAEYRAFKGWTKDRNAVARKLESIAARLSGPLYGGVMSFAQAKRLLLVEVDRKRVAKLLREEGATA